MKTHAILLFLLVLISTGLVAQETELTPIPDQYIITLKESVATPVALQETVSANREQTAKTNQPKRDANLSKLAQVRRVSGIDASKVLAEFADVIVGFTATLTPEEAALLASNPDVEGVYQDYHILLGPQPVEETPAEFLAEGQTIPCAITNAGGYANSTSGKYIWILDTGIDIDHPDLNVISLFPFAKSFIAGQTYDDGNGHGTHVAGIAAAKNNTIGSVGVSAGAPVVPIKVLANNGSSSLTYVIQGLNHVSIYDEFNEVVNLSLGAYPINNCENSNIPLRNAIKNLGLAGTWVVMAAGNEKGNAAMSSPGCINGTKVYTVGAMTCTSGCYTYSNWGSTVVDWVATGVNVYSTYRNGGYATLSGTSQATPVVSGIIHARAGAPVSGGTITCGNSAVPPAAYKKARRI